MARTHGRIMAAIWNDGDFIAMRGGAQRMFMFLLSQPDLSHAGLIPMRVNRWAKKAEDLSAKSIREELDYLAARDFVVVDEDTEEVLVRTFVRNDGVYKQPKVMIRLREDARQIESPMLRAAFKAELERLPMDELSDRPGGPNADQPSTRDQVERVVNTLRADFHDAERYPSEGVSDTHPDTPHVRAGAFHLPPTTVPQPPATATEEKPSSDKSDTIANLDRFEEFWETYGNKVDRKGSEAKWRLALKKPGVTADLLIAAAAAYVLYERTNNENGRYIMGPTKWLLNERWRDERTIQAPPPTRVQQHMALVRELAERDQPTLPQIGGAR